MVELQRSFGIRTTYGSALKARKAALSMLYGGVEDSFKLLLRYLEVLVQYNARMLTDLYIAPDGHFHHLFVALGDCRSPFEPSLRQVIIVDATHLKGRKKGVLFVDVTKDGNEHVFPLAIGVDPIENDESWIWFMTRLRMAFGYNDQLLIVSDQHISISNAMSAVYTGLDQIKVSNLTAYDKLMDVGPEKWTKSKCPARRYSFLTSNAAEVFNARLLDASRLSICPLLEAHRSIFETWFDQRRAKDANWTDDLTEEVVAKMEPLVEKSRSYNVVRTLQHALKVNSGTRS